MIGHLRPEEFREFFVAVHGVAPFPWQEGLARKVFAGHWPALDIPTGAGKTAVIDIAIFHLALEATLGLERRAPIRILFVVDRRLVVDDAYNRAQTVARKLSDRKLSETKDGILKRVADRLRYLAENEDAPLRVARLRGGMPKEPDWARTPAQPLVVVSTVDQVGSRFLFRGYGISDTMKPIHAGLVGADALLFLDEAHLSQPFAQTARDSTMFRTEPWVRSSAGAPFRIVTLSATPVPGEAEEVPLRIGDADRADSRLAPRLNVSKPAELVDPTSADDEVAAFADKAGEFAGGPGSGRVVAIVVNRVKRARAIFEALLTRGVRPLGEQSRDGESSSVAEAALLIGRARDLDRDRLLSDLLPFVHAGTARKPRTAPLFIVATQCIEAGADLDFDALVTEIAPLDCLRQRFGRLNRTGRDIEAEAAIVTAKNQIAKSAKPDPIYETAMRSTWNLLMEKCAVHGKGKAARRSIDFGIAHAAAWLPTGETLLQCLAPRKNAPILLPSAIDSWSRTSPIPFADPDVSLYLHGANTGPGDVEVVWRADIADADISGDDSSPAKEHWIERVGVCPPAALEAVSVPLLEAKRWLHETFARRRGTPIPVMTGDIADVEVGVDQPDQESGSDTALRWRGIRSDDNALVNAAEIKPGDVIVVPASRGGCDRWGWAPASVALVEDLGREANRRQRRRDILRLARPAPELSLTEEIVTAMRDWSDDEIRAHFASAQTAESGQPDFRRARVVRSTNGRPLAIERKLAVDRKAEDDSSGDAVTEDDDSLRATSQKRVLLPAHSQGVEKYARRFAEQLGLHAALAEDVALAAYLHDAGKAHPRFKQMLYGGDEMAAIDGPDLAKSSKLPTDDAPGTSCCGAPVYRVERGTK